MAKTDSNPAAEIKASNKQTASIQQKSMRKEKKKKKKKKRKLVETIMEGNLELRLFVR
uniref:Uncharacterized protein n=1 Tax=Cucumis melo TaxID=3656 RepID=A0A9I9DN25_CUCME